MNLVDPLQFAKSPAFASIWRRCCRESVPWDVFKTLAMPKGVEAKEAYAMILALQHSAGTIIPFGNYMPQISGPDNWFYETVEMHRLVRQVVAETSAGSDLDCALAALPARTRLSLRAADFSAACARDGLDLPAEKALAVWSGNLVPTSTAELLAANFPRALKAVAGSAAANRVSAGTLTSLWDILTLGITVPTETRRLYMVDRKKATPLLDPDISLLQIVSLIDTSKSGEINAVVRMFLAGGIFWDYNPFPFANCIMELVARELMARRECLPVMGLVPCSARFLDWERGQTVAGGRFLEEAPDVGEGFDSTAHFTGKLKIVTGELEQLRSRISSIGHLEASWKRMLDEDKRLNPRQREILYAALHDPRSRFFVADHERVHNVSHGTAYKDLSDLEGMGLLRREKRGRAIAYAATSRLAAMLTRAKS